MTLSLLIISLITTLFFALNNYSFLILWRYFIECSLILVFEVTLLDNHDGSDSAYGTLFKTQRLHADENIQHIPKLAKDYNSFRIWLKIRRKINEIPWEQMRNIKWMNKRATSRTAYVPTEVEHLANVVTHGIWVVPAIYAALQLLWRSKSSNQLIVAFVYGVALIMLFMVSTIFHSVFYCNRNRQLKDVLHRCDRAMIYVFIAGSYFPWLSLAASINSNILLCLKWMVWLLAALGILYQQIYHERYKCLETLLYLVMGLGPSIVILICGHDEFIGMSELKTGGLLYLLGICFFKADGSIPFAHAIWHIFVVLAASFHYYAILNYLYP